VECEYGTFAALLSVDVFALFSCFLWAKSVNSSVQSEFLLVANKGDDSIGVIDPVLGKQIAEIPEGGTTGHELTASPDGRFVYVPIYGDSGVGQPGTDGRNLVVIDLAARKVISKLDFGKGVRPHLPVIGPTDGLLYVSAELNQAISIIDPRTLEIIGSVPTGQEESHMFAITRDGRRAYTANVGPGTVSVLDLESKKLLKVIPVSGRVQRIALSVDDRMVFTSDVTKPELAVIDTATNQIKKWIALPGLGYGSAPTADGKWLLLAQPLIHKVAVVNLQSLEVEHTIDVPARPQEVLIRPDNKIAYVSCDASEQVAVIDLSTWKLERLIDAGKGVDGLAWVAMK
jgi:DNA-binding beta-propeller fold protein YncE